MQGILAYFRKAGQTESRNICGGRLIAACSAPYANNCNVLNTCNVLTCAWQTGWADAQTTGWWADRKAVDVRRYLKALHSFECFEYLALELATQHRLQHCTANQKMASESTCVHLKGLRGPRDLFTKRSFNKIPVTRNDLCIICGVLRPFWRSHKNKKSHERDPGYDTSSEPKVQSAQGTSKYDFVLFEDELGEAYHVLLCCLYLRWNAGQEVEKGITSKIYTTKKEGESEIEHLFAWYDVKLGHEYRKKIDAKAKEDLRKGRDTKKLATGIIGKGFEQCRVVFNREFDSQPQPLPDQETIFRVLREMLDHTYGWSQDKIHLQKYSVDYVRPSYLAKYWLNRYLRYTQGNKKLPEKKDVTNLAVIHCRLYAASNDGRWMNETILQHIFQAIRRANHRAKYTNGARISHILLYGDFVEADGQMMKAWFAKPPNDVRLEQVFVSSTSGTQHGKGNLRDLKETDDAVIEVMYVSRPWLPRSHGGDGNHKEETHSKVLCLWDEFRNPDVDNMPLQVKILAIWTMLCKRYGPKVCVIGHRSGFIEGAAFLGIPVIYLDCERLKCNENPGAMLYKPVVQEECKKRLHILANAMNTLIPVELFHSKRKQKKQTKQRVSEKSGSKNCESTEYQIKSRYDKELMAAIFMFMCCSLKPWWMRKGRIPGWTARVAMIHDRVESPYDERVVLETSNSVRPILEFLNDGSQLDTQPQDIQDAVNYYSQELPGNEAERQKEIDLFKKAWSSLSQQSGQEWLRRRFCFAEDPEVAGMFTYGWKFQEWNPARRQFSDHSDMSRPDVDQLYVDQQDMDQSDTGQSTVDESEEL